MRILLFLVCFLIISCDLPSEANKDCNGVQGGLAEIDDCGSKVIFIKAMRQAGLTVEDIFVIFYYNIFNFSKSHLFNLKVKIHFLCTWKDIISVIEKKKLYDGGDIANLNYFLSNPEDWRTKYA